MQKNILVFGYFGYVTGQTDGQTIKTRTVFRLLEKKLPHTNIDFFDTEILKKGYWKLSCLFFKLLRCRQVVYLPAHNNLRFFFPVLYFLSRLFRFEIIYILIGGWLPEVLEKNKKTASRMTRIRAVFPENKEVSHRLESEFGMKNVHMLPNFRETDFHPEFTLSDFSQRAFRLVFMSRITIAKGIENVFAVVKYLNERFPGSVSVDFFGQIDPDCACLFEKLLKENPQARYQGSLSPEKIIATLSRYDMLILPTFYSGEGFPGAIVESYLAGVPVAVSAWKYNAEYVHHEQTGFVVPLDESQVERYAVHIRWLMENPARLSEMKKRAFEEGKKFTAEAAWMVLDPFLSAGGRK